MKALQRKLFRDLWRSKWLLVTISSIITLGVACFVTFQSTYRNLNEAKLRYDRQCRMADFWIDLQNVPLAELWRVEQLPGISRLQSRIQFHVPLDMPIVDRPLSGIVISLPDVRRPVINDVVLRSGDWFTDRQENEVIVNERFAEHHGLRTGDSIHMVLNNRRQEMRIVGTAISSEFTYVMAPGSILPDPEHFGIFYIKRTFAEDAFDMQGAANQIVGRLSPAAAARPEPLLRKAEDLLDAYGVFNTTPLAEQTSNQLVTDELRQLAAMAAILPAIFLAVAALVLNVLMVRLTRQQRVIVGTLKALGYSDRQVLSHFLLFSSSVAILGGVTGIVAGYWLAGGMTIVYGWYYEFPDLRNELYAGIYAAGMLVSLGCSLAGSATAVRSMLRLQPAESMRPEPPPRGGAILLERAGLLWNRLSASWRVALRSMFRHRLRTGMLLFASAMGSGLLVSAFMFNAAVRHLVDFQFHLVTRSDYDLTFQDELGDGALKEVARLPGVDYVEPILAVGCTFVNGPYRRKGAVTGLVHDARLTIPRDRQGHPLRIPTTGVVMTRRMAERLHLQPGQSFSIVPVKGEQRTLNLTLAEITDSYMGMAVYADIEYLSRLIGEELAVNGAQLLADRHPDSQRAMYRELKEMPVIQSVQSRADMIQSIEETIVQNQTVFIVVLIVFAGTVFFGSLLNASMINLAERQREVATMRALGYTPWQVGSMLLRESMTANLIGTVFGLPIGYFLTWLTAVGVESDIFRLPIVMPGWIWIATFVLSILFALVAHAVVQTRLVRMDVLEGLKVKE